MCTYEDMCVWVMKSSLGELFLILLYWFQCNDKKDILLYSQIILPFLPNVFFLIVLVLLELLLYPALHYLTVSSGSAIFGSYHKLSENVQKLNEH